MKSHKGNTRRVLEHLKTNASISSIESFELYGVTRLSAIIFNLRKEGYLIESVKKEGKNRYGSKVRFVEYTLRGESNV